MVILFRRHEARRKCKYLNRKKYPEPRKHKDCSCMMASDGFVETPSGQRVWFRGSLYTRSWKDAEELLAVTIRPYLLGVAAKEDTTVDVAVEKFLATKKTELPARTDFGADSSYVIAYQKRTGKKPDDDPEQLRKYKDVLEPFQKFCKAQDPPLIFLKQVTYEHLDTFRNTWVGRPIWEDGKIVGNEPKTQIGKQRYQQNLKIFFAFALDKDWIDKDPARKLGKITVKKSVIYPYTDQEWLDIFNMIGPTFPKTANMVRAFVLVLKESALRISDVTRLGPQDLGLDGEIKIASQKTNERGWVDLPKAVLDALNGFPPKSKKHYFWTGNGQLETAKKDWSATMLKLFKAAKIEGGTRRRSHNFRKTLGIKVAEVAGLDSAQVVMAHGDRDTTEDFYAQVTPARIEQVRTALASIRKAEKKRLKKIA